MPFPSVLDGSNRLRLAALAVISLGWIGSADALVVVSDPDDPTPFLNLFRPTGKFDETGLSGFEFLISASTDPFRAADQYLIAGEETEPTTSIAIDRGVASDLSTTPFAFSIQHNLVGGRNFIFRVTNQTDSTTETLCWGLNCPVGSLATELLDGLAPIDDYNGLQIQVRAQEVPGSSAAVAITSLSGVDVAGADFFDEVVTPQSLGTIPGDAGRRGQWMLGDSLDLVVNEWELAGVVTLTRPDEAQQDVTKVRLAVDLVRDPNLRYVPEPSAGLLGFSSLAGLWACGRIRAASGRTLAIPRPRAALRRA